MTKERASVTHNTSDANRNTWGPTENKQLPLAITSRVRTAAAKPLRLLLEHSCQPRGGYLED